MKRYFLLGFLLASVVQTAQAAPLYEDMLKRVTDETFGVEPDMRIARFVHAVHGEEWGMSEEDIVQLMKGESPTVCTQQETGDAAKAEIGCATIKKTLEVLVQQETNIRSLGRMIQGTVSSFELPISELPSRSIGLTTDLRSIISIWSAGTGSTKSTITGAVIRTISAEPDDFRSALEAIGQELEKIEGDEQIGAVWRYQYGVRLLAGDRSPSYEPPVIDGEDTAEEHRERQYLYKRWNEDDAQIEGTLQAFWTTVERVIGTTNLAVDETIYVVFPDELLDETLPDNVIVWARIDGNASKGHPFGDVGLQWKLPLDPVLPSLTDDETGEALLGGEYPPEPVDKDDKPRDGSGLCTDPVALRGYLCRNVPSTLSPDSCDASADAENDTVTLVHCEKEDTERFTLAGPDVCREINWKEIAPVDSNSQCTVNVRCGDACGGDQSNTLDKDGARIDVCMLNSPTRLPAEYQLYKELVHAAQQCGLPARGDDDPYVDMDDKQATVACCQRESEAYEATCALIERDGVFDYENAAFAGTPYNAETCMEALANEACTGGDHNLQGCYVSRPYSSNFAANLSQHIRDNSPTDIATSCAEAQKAPRIINITKGIDQLDRVCRPTEETTYKNRIGNNLCFIGQCIEETTELLRATPGRTSMTTGSPVAPWDSPTAGTPQGTLLLNPPLTAGALPSYKPKLLVRTMEEALCASQGLPPRTPPILCTIEAERQSSYGLQGVISTAGALRQAKQTELTTDDLLRLSPALGSRIGTNLYADYLQTGVRSLAEIMTMASDLLEDMNSIHFPTEMCPVSEGLPTPRPTSGAPQQP